MADERFKDAIEYIAATASEIAEIHSGSDYSLWRQDAVPRLQQKLEKLEPFKDYRNVWLYMGDGSGMLTPPRFGEWVIDLLVEKKTPQTILSAFIAEVEKNQADYDEVSPALGIEIDEVCELGDGARLCPGSQDVLASLANHMLFQPMLMPSRTSLLRQTYTVTPAFERGQGDEFAQAKASTTSPETSSRHALRERIRLACLLAGNGPVEFPFSVLRSETHNPFMQKNGFGMGRPFGLRPLQSMPISAAAVKRAFHELAGFKDVDSLARAVDRLGRSRLAISPVDRALDLGIAAEIVLMHDQSSNNTEISFKIGSRAAWLLGQSSAEREAISSGIRALYNARSKAVHKGVLPTEPPVDLVAADQLVTRVLLAILARGAFPNWNNLTMGGAG